MKDRIYVSERLSPQPHYFGIGVVGDSILDPNSDKNDRYCEILDYQEFDSAVPFKIEDNYVEEIPISKATNYWRFGVREIAGNVYESITALAKLSDYTPNLPHPNGDFESFRTPEGTKKQRFSTYYERNPFYRTKAIEIHGLTCIACGVNFGDVYGTWGEGFIHVHHNKPASETGPTAINSATDMSVGCPNCHAMIHRKKTETLSVEEVKGLRATRTQKVHIL
jgi:putative restriction endonuclease